MLAFNEQLVGSEWITAGDWIADEDSV